MHVSVMVAGHASPQLFKCILGRGLLKVAAAAAAAEPRSCVKVEVAVMGSDSS